MKQLLWLPFWWLERALHTHEGSLGKAPFLCRVGFISIGSLRTADLPERLDGKKRVTCPPHQLFLPDLLEGNCWVVFFPAQAVPWELLVNLGLGREIPQSTVQRENKEAVICAGGMAARGGVV